MTRKFLLAAALIAGAVFLASPAYAAAGSNADGIGAASSVGVGPHAWQLVVDAGTWQLLNLLLVPLLVGLATKAATTAKRKIIANAAITGLSTLLALFVARPDGVHVLDSATLIMWAVSAAIAVLGHYGLYKPLGVTGSTPTSGLTMPERGLL